MTPFSYTETDTKLKNRHNLGSQRRANMYDGLRSEDGVHVPTNLTSFSEFQ